MMSVSNKYSNLTLRIITSLTGIMILVAAMYWSEWTYFMVFFLICLLTQQEFFLLIKRAGIASPFTYWGILTGQIIYTLTFLIQNEILVQEMYFLIFPVIVSIFLIKLYKKSGKKSFDDIAFTYLGIIYIAVPFTLIHFLAFHQGYYHHQILLGVFIILWASDSGAYLIGSQVGKKKLFERISPKKTWEGSIGGALIAIAATWIIAHYMNDLQLWEWVCISGTIIVVGTWGDLVESLLKRSIEIKDSGHILPGHGGFLDRLDGLLLSIPVIVAFLKIINYL